MNSTAMSNSPLQLIKAHLSKAWGKLKPSKAPTTQEKILRQSKVIERRLRSTIERNKNANDSHKSIAATLVQSDADRAWQTVVMLRSNIFEPILTLEEQSKYLHVSIRSLLRMKRVFEKIVADKPKAYPEDKPATRIKAMMSLSEIGWDAARALAKFSG